MSKSFKDKLPTILFVLAVALFFVGMFLVAYSLQDTYSVVGECEPGTSGCKGITWQENAVRLGSLMLVVGPILGLLGIYFHERNKKPQASN